MSCKPVVTEPETYPATHGPPVIERFFNYPERVGPPSMRRRLTEHERREAAALERDTALAPAATLGREKANELNAPRPSNWPQYAHRPQTQG